MTRKIYDILLKIRSKKNDVTKEKMNTNRKTARILEDVQIILSALWAAIMFLFQQGDVQRLYSGDFIPGGEDITGGLMSMEILWLISAITMTIPVVMVFLSLTLKYKVNRRANIILAIFFFVYSLNGLRMYPSAYDKFLLIVSLVFNALTVWYAWKWSKQEGQPQGGNL